jgi:hypothetical protein
LIPQFSLELNSSTEDMEIKSSISSVRSAKPTAKQDSEKFKVTSNGPFEIILLLDYREIKKSYQVREFLFFY